MLPTGRPEQSIAVLIGGGFGKASYPANTMRIATDENFNNSIVRGLLRRQPDLDIKRVLDASLLGADDPAVLAWAAGDGRILLTHDRTTMPDFAYARVAAGQLMPGLVIVNDRAPIGQMIDELVLIATCSLEGEWEGKVLFLPLR